MRAPSIRATIERRRLVNYRIDSDVLAAVLPAPFRPTLVGGYGVGGICLIRLGHIRPSGLPARAGLTTENAAHRVAVEWDTPTGSTSGVYIPRRDTSSKLVALLGGRTFPGWHHLADFQVDEGEGNYQVRINSRDRAVTVAVRARLTEDVTAGSVFSDVDQASQFFRSAPVGYAATPKAGTLDGGELSTCGWGMSALELLDVESSFFDDRRRFPQETAVLDSAFLMEGLDTSWSAMPPLRTTAPAMHTDPSDGALPSQVSGGVSTYLWTPGLRLFLRCLRWGIATGAATGAVVGAAIGAPAVRGGLSLGLALGGALYGVVIGAIVAVIPSVPGGLVVSLVLERRHRHETSREALEQDLNLMFFGVVGVLDATLLLAMFLLGNGLSTLVSALPVVLLAHACVAVMLWRARASITRLVLTATWD